VCDKLICSTIVIVLIMELVSIVELNEMVRYYGKKYVGLLDDTCETFDRIKKCLAFVEKTSLQACHEHLKLQYKQLFEICLQDYYIIIEGIDDFPSVVDDHCNCAQRIGTMKEKETCNEFLESLLLYHETCAGNLKERVMLLEKRGMDAYALVSRLPRNVCA
jgi:hypothetical protein